jgi:hypothetical protein
MSGFHYTREAGELGQVLAREGEGPGLALEQALAHGRPPLRAAMELGAALADILCIAEEDRLVHGDLRPSDVRIDERGNVSIDGWGLPRKTTRAPEGRPDLASADTFGLGLVLHRALSDAPFGDVGADPDAHDDAVVERVLGMDFSDAAGKRWVGDVRKFLCKILAWHPEDRPLPLDAANVLASVAADVDGDGLARWAARLGRAPAPAPAAMPVIQQEILGGPTSIAAPLARGGVRQAPASKGESTSFWSREKIAQMLAEEDEEDESGPLGAPQPMAAPQPARPPFNPPPAAPPPPSAPPPRAVPAPPSVPPPPTLPAVPSPPPAETPSRPTPPPSPPPRAAAPPPAAPAPTRLPSQAAPPARPAVHQAAPPEEDPFADPPRQGGGMMIAGGMVVVVALLCAGLGLAGGAWWMWGRDAGTVEAPVVPASETKPAPEPPAAAPPAAAPTPAPAPAEPATKPAAPAEPASKPAAPAEPAAKPPSAAPSSRPSGGTSAETAPTGGSKATTKAEDSGTKTTGTSTSRPTEAKAATPTSSTKTTKASPAETAPPPASGPFTVKFNVPAKEGKIQCGDGQTSEFVGSATMSFQGLTTCRVKTRGKEGIQGVIQVERAGAITCTDAGTSLSCK